MPAWNETNKPHDASEVLELEIKQCSQPCSSFFTIKKNYKEVSCLCSFADRKVAGVLDFVMQCDHSVTAVKQYKQFLNK